MSWKTGCELHPTGVSTERPNQSVEHAADFLAIVIQELPSISIEVSKISGEQKLTLDLADGPARDFQESHMLSVALPARSFGDVRNH